MVSRASPARRAAFEILTRVDEGKTDPASALHDSRHSQLSPADRDLMTEITYGVLRWRNLLDRIVSQHSKRPFHRIDPVARTALRIGLYQIRFLDRVPDRAAVDESVRLTRDFGSPSAAPFVNAVLRNALREPGLPVLPVEDDALAYLTTTLSHPEWLARRYLKLLGRADARSRCELQNRPPPVDLRVTRRTTSEEARRELDALGVVTSLIPGVPNALRVESGSLRDNPLLRDGRVAIQEAGSQLVASLVGAGASDRDVDAGASDRDVGAGASDRVLDLCAAPGGKSAALADDANPGLLLALEIRHNRSRLTRQRADRLGADNVQVVTADGTRPPIASRFRRVLLDAPCSGLGTLRRNPDIKWRVRESDLARHHDRQLALLRAAAGLLEPGGRLVYATCSTEPEENQDVVEEFLSHHEDFRLVPCPEDAPRSPEGFLETRPERDGMDGYFAAVLTSAKAQDEGPTGH